MSAKFVVAVMLLAACMMIGSAHADAKDTLIKNGSKVSFDYTLTVDGKVIDSSEGKQPLAYTQGESQLLPALTSRMEGMKAGDEKTIELKGADAYGQPDPAALREVPISNLPPDRKPEVGMMLQARDKDGQAFPVRIAEVKSDTVVLDLNHPLAGKTLLFKVKIVSVQ